MNSITPLENYINTSKNNLIQNFYIIGFPPNEFFKLNKKEKTGEFADIFKEKIEDMPLLTPKLITKFPNVKNSINTISDEIVIDHCFPNREIKIFKKSKDEQDNPKTFQFELDNIPQNYENNEQNIYSKIYFNCLEISESISEYFKYKKEIINLIFNYKSITIKNFDKNEPQGIDDEKKYSDFKIPKILCFASILPFYNELSLLLKCIYDYYLSRSDFSSLPLEKVIEKIIMNTPIPLEIGTELSIHFKTSSYKEKIVFPLCNINEININYSNNMSLIDIFKYFSSEDIIRIFKYIIFEVPMLFFCEDKSILSLLVNTFLSALSPFKYVFPHIAILPKRLYGLINTEEKFIFGINQNYNENFFLNNKIELDKTMIVISIIIDQQKKTAKINFDEKIFDKNNYDKLIVIKGINRYEDSNSIIHTEIPNSFKKELLEGISKYLSFTKKKNFFSKKENIPKDLTFKIQNTFYRFFISILNGYTAFFIKSPNFYNETKNVGEKMHFKYDFNFVKEVFNSEDFISKSPKECQTFYSVFFKTKLFNNFIYERIYNNSIIHQFALKQFDQLTYLKKYKESRKRKENKTFFENFKNEVLEKVKVDKKEEIYVIEDNTFSNTDIKCFVSDEEKNTDILLNCGQLIKLKPTNYINNNEKNSPNLSKLVDTNYCIFPKLLFEYLNLKNNNLIFVNNDYISHFIDSCKSQKEKYEKIRPYAFVEKMFENMNYAKSEKNYSVSHYIYIKFIWAILLSCSLWYCQPEEIYYRLDKLFEVLDKMDNIEEYVLNLLYINIFNFGDKYHIIKMYMLYNKYIEKKNYYFLNLLCNKISKKDNNEMNMNNNIEDEDEQNDLVFSKRYLIKVSNEFSKKRKDKLLKNPSISEDSEEIIFSTEQICKKCNEIGDFDIKEIIKIIQNKNNLIEESYKYKCPKCKNEEQDIIIKFQILLFNYSKNEAFITETGDFSLLTPFKLYKDLKKYLTEENRIKLEIKNIFDIKDKINLINTLFYFNILSLPFDFLLPYIPTLKSSMRLFFENTEKIENSKIYKRKVSQPIRIAYKEEVSYIYRKFKSIAPKYNIKKKKSFLGISYGTTYIESDLSFTIKKKK